MNALKNILCYIENLLARLMFNRFVTFLATIVGQIISTQTVIGNKVRMMTRYSYQCILDRASWKAPVLVSREAEMELKFWQSNIQRLNSEGSNLCQLTDDKVFDIHVL